MRRYCDTKQFYSIEDCSTFEKQLAFVSVGFLSVGACFELIYCDDGGVGTICLNE
jgi:hypothetical protein